MKKIKFTDTILRDAHQSLIATRLSTKEMIPILEKIDQAGYYSIEMWGGATFDSCLRYLNEDPWERLRIIRKAVKNTNLQMLLRGQNLLGYKHYSDDIVDMFVKKSIENGIDIIRIFDALNDVRNLETAVKSTKKEKGHVQCAISYTTSPVHNVDYYVKVAKQMRDIGADSICIKDMAGILLPQDAFDLVKALKENVDLELEVHSHYTSGVASMMYLKAIEAGADIIDTAVSPFAMGTSQPPTESMVATLLNSGYDVDVDLKVVSEIADYFKVLKEKYVSNGMLNHKVASVDPNALIYQVPGGMLSNLLSQLKGQNMEEKYEDVLREVPKVREELGFPPLVTPLSQMVGTQAVMNVVTGERYKLVPKEIKDYVKGLYGKSPAEINEEVKTKIIGQDEVITCRPADLIEPQFDKIKNEIKEFATTDEDILSYALFPDVSKKFLEGKWAEKYKIEGTLYNSEDVTHPV
ncbi:oxaloacetate decarboxylase alpha subunit [Acetoanaerobium pronyense]|uniref:Oxaloacetate decarboxylase alpha subunit n=1 Tax=Acetoanaerobium pronyense TaxID=1482736 RepID=A0ABS4KK69_9FIRM|nr:oxaloacetate decarboxylase subunit alpha [Acetoanaerobium pronyense]MBP2028188.1 oxaloacetate decarboxylase alpha subunit [Acetoanaerobium pronyense]